MKTLKRGGILNNMLEAPKPGKWLNDRGFCVHRDIQEALMNYQPGGDSLSDVFEQRDQQVEDGEEYWNTNHDAEMLETAWERSHNPGWWLGDDYE